MVAGCRHMVWLVVAGLVPLATAGVLTVADDGTGDFEEIQAAVDAATERDTILVFAAERSYAPVVVDGIALTLVGIGRPVVESVAIEDLGPGEPVVLRGFELRPSTSPPGVSQPGLAITTCRAPVFVEECLARGFASDDTFLVDDAVTVFDASAVAFVRCDVAGLDAVADFGPLGGGPGGGALGIAASTVSVFDSLVVGGAGGAGDATLGAPGGAGGHAVSHVGGGLVVYGSTLAAGAGGDAGCGALGCSTGGPGGSALWTGTLNSILVEVVDSQLVPGAGGAGDPPGETGQSIFGAENTEVVSSPVLARTFQGGPSPAAAGSVLEAEVSGVLGDIVFLFASLAPGRTLVPGLDGPLALDEPVLVGDGALLILDRAATGLATLEVPEAVAVDLDVYLQAVFRDAAGVHVGPPSVLTVGPDASVP